MYCVLPFALRGYPVSPWSIPCNFEQSFWNTRALCQRIEFRPEAPRVRLARMQEGEEGSLPDNRNVVSDSWRFSVRALLLRVMSSMLCRATDRRLRGSTHRTSQLHSCSAVQCSHRNYWCLFHIPHAVDEWCATPSFGGCAALSCCTSTGRHPSPCSKLSLEEAHGLLHC